MIVLNEKAKSTIKSDRGLFIELQKTLSVSENAFYRMLKTDSNRLTEIDFLNTLVSQTETPLSDFIDGKFSKLLVR